jgi:hypothetical protein
MGNKDKGKRETKKPSKKQSKVAPTRKREDFNQVTARIVRENTEKP